MQRISIERLQVPTLIGVYDWERTRQTQLLMTIDLIVDVTDATLSDDVSQTIDYAKVAEHIKSQAANTSFELLEALGRHLCESVLAHFPVQQITLKIEKPDILPDAATVHVTQCFNKQGQVTL
jgi:dihydroneopterin aldolase